MRLADLKMTIGVFLFFFSLLAVFKAPVLALWIPALAVTEGGTYAAIGCALWLLLVKPSSIGERMVRGLVILAALLFLSPLVRALALAPSLPASFQKAFGDAVPRSRPNATARSIPLSFVDLFRPLPSPTVEKTTVTYSTIEGHSLQMDLYRPSEKNENVPVVLVVHGGSWHSGDREEFSGFDRYLAAHGYLVAAMDYRLVPDAVFPAPRDDVFAAVDYLRQHAVHLGWDRKNLVLLGRSAGGQIALSAAYAGKIPEIRGVVVFYTPNDLIFGYENPGNPWILNSKALIQNYLGVPYSQDHQALYVDASPLYAVGPSTPPTLMIHGGRDELVWSIHEERLSQKLQAAGRPYFYLRLPWATHGCDALLNGPSGQISTYVIEHFLAAVIPS